MLLLLFNFVVVIIIIIIIVIVVIFVLIVVIVHAGYLRLAYLVLYQGRPPTKNMLILKSHKTKPPYTTSSSTKLHIQPATSHQLHTMCTTSTTPR